MSPAQLLNDLGASPWIHSLHALLAKSRAFRARTVPIWLVVQTGIHR